MLGVMSGKILRSLAAAVAIALLPAAAWAVNVSSNEGYGHQTASRRVDGFYGAGLLTSTHGNPVYYFGRVVYDNNTDEDCGRYTADTVTGPVERFGTCSGPLRFDTEDGAKMKICRNINNLPDSCGSWSATDRF